MDNQVVEPEPSPVAERWHVAHRRVLLLVGLAGLFRALLLLLPRQIRWDEPAYLLLGRSLLSGDGFTLTGVPEVHFPPLFPVLFGAVWKLVRNPELATDLWLVVAGALLVLPVYALAARAFDRSVATGAALLVAVFPGLSTSILYWGSMTEPVFLLLLYSAAWLLVRAVDLRDGRRAAAAGMLLGLAYLGRPEALGWLATLAVGAGVVVALTSRSRIRAAAAVVPALALGFALCAAPYVIYLHHETGRWLLTGKLGITYELGEAVLEADPALYDEITNAIDPQSGEVRWESQQRFEPVADHRMAELAQRIGGNLQRLLRRAAVQPVFPILLVPFVFLAWLEGSWRPQRWSKEAWLWALVLPVGAFLGYHVQQRFFAPAFPALLVWTAAGIAAARRWLARRWPRWRLTAQAPALVAIAILAVAHATVLREELGTLREVHRNAGLWLRDHSPRDARILSYELDVCVWAERRCLLFPRAPLEEVLAYARQKGGTYVLVDEAESREARPFLLPLLDPAIPPPEGLERLFTTSDAHGRAVVFGIAASTKADRRLTARSERQ